MHPLRTHTQPYEWGSPTLLAEMLGIAPTGGPVAELWIGAHPSLPSQIRLGADWVDLDAAIAADPNRWLGRRAVARFGPRLPLLLKVLAVAAPLSLQAHPDLAAARAGFAAEEHGGLPATHPDRSFRDDNHKPELITALTPMEALYGFGSFSDLDARRSELRSQLFDDVLGTIDSPKDIRSAVRRLLRLERPDATALNCELGSCLERLRSNPDIMRWGILLADRYPSDPGVGVALLLNHVQLEPGTALFVPAGVLHAYLDGVGVEVLASSDNVMRAGLTPKRVDIEGLLRILDANPRQPKPTTLFDAPACPDFRLHRLGPLGVPQRGPGLVLCVAGQVRGGGLVLQQGEAAFWGADEPVELRTEGTAFAATLGEF